MDRNQVPSPSLHPTLRIVGLVQTERSPDTEPDVAREHDRFLADNETAGEPVDPRGAAEPLTPQYLTLLRSLSGPERLRRALELTALARDLTWAGAVRHAGHLGEAAVRDRFLRQFHGDEVARALAPKPTQPNG